MDKIRAFLATLTISLIGTGVAIAADYQFIDDASLIGLSPGFDGLWASADDLVVPGLNTLGAASAFSDENGNFGYFSGTFSTNASGPAFYGVNSLTSTSTVGEVNNSFVPFFNSPYTQTFDPGINTVTIAANNTATAIFSLNQVDAFGGQKLAVTGSYSYLLPGQDPAVIFAGNIDLINHINFLLPLIPADWTWFATGFETYEFTAGINIGAFGGDTKSLYSTDTDAALPAVPIPAAIWLFGPALGMLGWMRRKAA
jgi:hypothetical protein